MEGISPALIALVQAGGVLAFALVVYLQLRAQEKTRSDEATATRKILSELAGDIRSMLERERMRAETPPQGMPQFRPPNR